MHLGSQEWSLRQLAGKEALTGRVETFTGIKLILYLWVAWVASTSNKKVKISPSQNVLWGWKCSTSLSHAPLMISRYVAIMETALAISVTV